MVQVWGLKQGTLDTQTLSLRESRARVPSKLSSTGGYLKTLGLGRCRVNQKLQA